MPDVKLPACRVSGKHKQIWKYQMILRRYSSNPGEMENNNAIVKNVAYDFKVKGKDFHWTGNWHERFYAALNTECNCKQSQKKVKKKQLNKYYKLGSGCCKKTFLHYDKPIDHFHFIRAVLSCHTMELQYEFVL